MVNDEHTHAGSARNDEVVIMRNRAFRRHAANTKMWRRLHEDRNQHYDDLTCPCWTSPKHIAKFREQPKLCSCWMCRNRRKNEGRTMQEKRAGWR